MKIFKSISVIFFVVVAGMGAFQFYDSEALARSTYFSGRGCTVCHASPVVATCNGCHHHGNNGLSAATDKTSYAPGEMVTATLSGGNQSGWIRAILYDHNNVQVAISNGNASGMGFSTTFPAPLSAAAPTTPGTYTWQMAYFGNQDGTAPGGDVHSEVRVNTNSFTVTAAPNAMIGTTGYPSLTAAYTAAAPVATIMTPNATLAENFNMSMGKDITLDGGYDTLFQLKTGQPTTLQGILTVASGSLTVDGLSIM
jgi:hypothetical protein